MRPTDQPGPTAEPLRASVHRIIRQAKNDILVQRRNQLYSISIAIAAICGGALAWLSSDELLARTVPMALLLFVGGSTLLYVVAMIILEKDDGVLNALSVSPLRPSEYLLSKVLTLTILATVEGVLLVAGGLVLRGSLAIDLWPNAWVLVGLVALAIIHVLFGILIVVRYRRITEALLPMGAVAVVLQVPALQVVGAIDSPLVYVIPSYAPTLIARGGFVDLDLLHWSYALGFTLLSIGMLAPMALRAFEAHVVRKVG